MRFLARFGLSLCGLAIAASPAVLADDFSAPVLDPSAPQQTANATGHHHKGLFGWRHCTECQRAMAKKRDGVDVPPPPSTIPAAAMAGQVVHVQGDSASCPACQAGTVVSGPVTVVESYPAGRAVVGGPVLAGTSAPGYAVVGEGGPVMAGTDPAPVGVSRAAQPHWNGPRMAQARPMQGAYDPSVMPSSMIPAQTPLSGASNRRPHILGHLFGITELGHHRRDAREEQARESHAAISYSPPNEQVNELPASMVYGKR
jgi:hypothetical protein